MSCDEPGSGLAANPLKALESDSDKKEYPSGPNSSLDTLKCALWYLIGHWKLSYLSRRQLLKKLYPVCVVGC